ncbi:uncharacterized protein LOC115979888 isoform X2 [Quercus lobata]|uniref:uncharacterized protein LOC115979888 isoform X2 n=1 Tax=Quercus lobata TaxID=97700 RepID=UPI00124586CE|nr:uncharacterized protein LOC115979888 isoform X2 [Quercus lobata]
MLLHYLSTISPPEPIIPPRIYAEKYTVFPPESPGTSSLMAARHDSGETPTSNIEDNSAQAREKAEKEGFEVSNPKTQNLVANTKALAENEGEGLAKHS